MDSISLLKRVRSKPNQLDDNESIFLRKQQKHRFIEQKRWKR
jgi:hypothetical protein